MVLFSGAPEGKFEAEIERADYSFRISVGKAVHRKYRCNKGKYHTNKYSFERARRELQVECKKVCEI